MNAFQRLLAMLSTEMRENFLAVNPARNPIGQIMHRGEVKELVYVVQQYAIFPKAIVDLMEIARRNSLAAGWQGVANELQENIAEEMGRGTNGISHYNLFADGLEAVLKIPVKRTQPSAATQQLLQTMDDIFKQSAAHVLGATYAIEATSIPELNLVKHLIELLLEGALSQDLEYFFDMHLNEWEPEHEEDLRKTLEQYIQPQDFPAFSQGFRAVLTAMDVWWLQLTAEGMAQSLVLQTV